MSNRKKICFIAGCLGKGGAERQLFYNVKFLSKMKSDAIIISFTKGEYWENKINKYSRVITIDEYNNPIIRIFKILKILRENKIDIVQSQHFFINIYTYIVSKILRIRGIGAIRSDIKNLELQKNSFWRKVSFFNVGELSMNSKSAIKTAKKLGINGENIHLIPNVIDIDEMEVLDKNNNDVINILYVGRLVKSKRVDIFINVFKKILALNKFSVSAKIIGDGDELSNLKKICRSDYLLKNKIQFLGSLDVNDLPKYYKEADIFLFCSDYEGTPNVIIEAMCYGLAIVSSEVGDIKELIMHDYNGYLVSSENPDDYLKHMIELCTNNDKRIMFGKNSIKHIKENRSLDTLKDYYKNLKVI
jgi:glycosyltransferase involved in cell wall biosynthesis